MMVLIATLNLSSFVHLSSSCPCLTCRMPRLFSCSSMSCPHGYLISVWIGEAIPRSSVQVRVHQASSGWTGVWGHSVSSALGAACCHVITGVSHSSSETGGMAGGLSLWLSRVSPGLWCWVGHMVVTPSGAMFTANLNFWRGNMRMVRWVTGSVVPLSLWRNV